MPRETEKLVEPLEAAEQTREQDDAISLVERDREHLREIEHAIHKMSIGLYGISEMSGDPIPYARLHAIRGRGMTATRSTIQRAPFALGVSFADVSAAAARLKLQPALRCRGARNVPDEGGRGPPDDGKLLDVAARRASRAPRPRFVGRRDRQLPARRHHVARPESTAKSSRRHVTERLPARQMPTRRSPSTTGNARSVPEHVLLVDQRGQNEKVTKSTVDGSDVSSGVKTGTSSSRSDDAGRAR